MISWNEFKHRPLQDCTTIAPSTLVLAAGGTRRRAQLNNIPRSEYPSWSRNELFDLLKMLFRSGVRHLFCVILSETNTNETSQNYRENMTTWATEMLSNQEAIDFYNAEGWQVRIEALGWPELLAADQNLQAATSHNKGGPTLWYTAVSSPDARWNQLIQVASQAPARTEMIRAIYGEDIAPATMFVGTGKPQILPSVINPILIGNLSCYWPQSLGYSLSKDEWKQILYDYAYLRPTWVADKSKRTKEILKYKAQWESPPIIGTGQRLGPFWFPGTK